MSGMRDRRGDKFWSFPGICFRIPSQKRTPSYLMVNTIGWIACSRSDCAKLIVAVKKTIREAHEKRNREVFP